MKKGKRFVLDTNVIISGLIYPQSVPRKAVDTAFDTGTVLTSSEVAEELFRILGRPKLSSLIDQFELEAFVEHYSDQTEFVLVNDHITVCRDPLDDKFLELAVSGNAGVIVSGDNDLASLGSFQGIKILSASEFIKKM